MIKIDKEKNLWVLETKNSAYSFALNSSGNLETTYFGEKLSSVEDYRILRDPIFSASFDSENNLTREEYSFWQGARYKVPGLKVDFLDGTRSTQMVYSSHNIKGNNLSILFKDDFYGLNVVLNYLVHEEFDIIEKWVEISNCGESNIKIDSLMSGILHVPIMKDYRLNHYSGHWCGEFQQNSETITTGKKVLDSRRGHTSHYNNPSIFIDNGTALQESGEVVFAQLAWSGNWIITVEKDVLNQVQVVCGLNDFDFNYILNSGNKITTPKLYIGHSNSGFGGLSRNIHRFQQLNILRDNNKIRPVLYNSWEATYFDVTVDGQKKLAKKASDIGVELFVLDDGWFGNRNNDSSGLGDWIENVEKFPNGLKPLIDYVNKLNMDFGLWLEPEMVNVNSNLYKNHPNWIYQQNNRVKTELRNQLVLDFSNKEVLDYIKESIDRLLSNNNIKFIKWDMNRALSEVGNLSLPESRQKELWLKHTQGVYEIWSYINKKYPEILIESCSGGGGRVDSAAMEYAGQFWTSDNTDPVDRLKIQEGFLNSYNPKIMVCWVTDSPNFVNRRETSLEYRLHSAMMGSFGIGTNLNGLSEEELIILKDNIRLYKSIRNTIQNGLFYKIESIINSNRSVYLYTSEDKKDGVLFTFSNFQEFGGALKQEYIKIPGLDLDLNYNVDGFECTFTGLTLKNRGIPLRFIGNYSSSLIRIKSV